MDVIIKKLKNFEFTEDLHQVLDSLSDDEVQTFLRRYDRDLIDVYRPIMLQALRGDFSHLEFWSRHLRIIDKYWVSMSKLMEIDAPNEDAYLLVLRKWVELGIPVDDKFRGFDPWHKPSGIGHLRVLQLMKDIGVPIGDVYNVYEHASGNGHVHVLQWWLDNFPKVKYGSYTIKHAVENGHINVLQ